MKEPEFKIDFVVSWVDGNDPLWQKKKNGALPNTKISTDSKKDTFNADNRYREYGLFKYWFRSIEKYAPWVRKIFLVTDNQVPNFLNLNNKKVVLVKHSDFIDQRFLPTFDSSTIELNIHKIKNLSEHFVYFNDDMFLNVPVCKSDFFSFTGHAKDTIGQSIIMPVQKYDHNILNNVAIINQNYRKKEVLKKYWNKFFNLRQGLKIVSLNFLLTIFPKFTRLYDPHTAYSLIKSDMKKIIDENQEVLNIAFQKPFRTIDDYTIQLVRYYQIVSGHADPRCVSFGNTANSDDVSRVKKLLKRRSTKVVNINDSVKASDQDLRTIKKLFSQKFKKKSGFELND